MNYFLDFEFYTTKLSWSEGLFCDFSLIVNVYNLWISNKEKRKSKEEEKKWAERSNLNLKSIYEMEDLKKKIEKTLLNEGICLESETDWNFKKDLHTEQDLVDENYVIKFMIAGAFYPYYYKTRPRTSEDDIMRTLSCKNPLTTIAISRFPNNENYTYLYHNQLQQKFHECSKNITLDYEKNKVLIEFPANDNPNIKISKGLHAAIYISKRNGNKINVYPPDFRSREYQKAIDNIECHKRTEGVHYRTSFALNLTTGRDHLGDVTLVLQNLNEVELKITEVNKVGEFWAQIKEKESELEKIENLLNLRHKKLDLIDRNSLKVNQLAVTLFFDQKICLFARIKIIKLEESRVEVFYIDYGNHEYKDYNLIFDIYKDLENIPHQAMKFQLINLRMNPLRKIEDNDVAKFSSLMDKKRLKAKIYSIVQNVVRIQLIESKEFIQKDLSKDIIKIGLMEYCDESEDSQVFF